MLLMNVTTGDVVPATLAGAVLEVEGRRLPAKRAAGLSLVEATDVEAGELEAAGYRLRDERGGVLVLELDDDVREALLTEAARRGVSGPDCGGELVREQLRCG